MTALADMPAKSRRAQNREEFIFELIERGCEPKHAEAFYDRSRNFPEELIEGCATLLKTRRFRSAFRRSLCEQLIDWIEDPQPTYTYPFSDRQAFYVSRSYAT